MLATLAIKREGFVKVRRLAGLAQDSAFAEAISVDKATVYRVLNGKTAPGPRFIAGCIERFGGEWFTDLFDVVPDDEAVA